MPHDDSGASVDAGEPSPPEPVASTPASAEPEPAPLEPPPGRPPLKETPTRRRRGWLARTLALRARADDVEALRQSEHFLSDIINTVPGLIFVVDENGKHILINQALSRTLHIDPERAVGLTTSEFGLVPEVVEQFERENREVIETGQPMFVPEKPVPLPDGKVVYLETHKFPIALPDGRRAVIGITQDTTPRRLALEARWRIEAQLHAIIERAPDGILVCRAGRFTYVNPALIELLGYDHPDDLIGRPILDIVAPDHRSRMGSLLRAIGDAKGPVSPWEQRWLRRSGASLSVECAGLTIELDGQPSVLVFARDITERKSVEANLQWTERMVAIGTLAAGAAHEINNPIAYILLNLGIISARLDTLKNAVPPAVAADLGRLLRETREGAERVRDIVRDLRMLSRPPHEERLTLVDLKAAVEAAVHMAQHEIKGRARLTQTYEDTFWVEACESRLAQLFLNLLINAAQAIPESGAEAEHEIRVTVRKGPGGRAIVEVSDTGSGIAASNLDRIFDPFFTTKPVGLGTGLGLAVCHGIVRSLGGDIAVASELGRGTTFRVSLPLKPPPSDAADERASETPWPRPRARILVMDSEPAVAASLSALLSEEHEVVATSSGLEALALLTEPGDRFDVILSDLTMPDLSGAEVFERIRSARPELADRFIFMSGGVVTPSSLEFLVAARSAHLEKPFTPARLLALISAIAARR